MAAPYLAFYLHIIVLFFAAFIHYRSLSRVVLGVDLLDVCAATLLVGSYLLGAYSLTAAGAGVVLILLVRFHIRLGGYQQGLVTGLLVVWCLLLATHQLPGFSRPQVLHDVVVSAGRAPFNLVLGLDKAFAGAVLFIYLLPNGHPGMRGYWFWTAILSTLLLLLLAWELGFHFDPKVGTYLFWFLPINLFITCVAEEMFFRGVVQDTINKLCGAHLLGAVLAVVVTSYLFILAHGIVYPTSSAALLYTAASLLYALLYQHSKRVELSIITHFIVNVGHILLLPYPL